MDAKTHFALESYDNEHGRDERRPIVRTVKEQARRQQAGAVRLLADVLGGVAVANVASPFRGNHNG